MADMHSATKKMRLSEPTTKIRMKIDPYYQRQKCRPLTLVSGDIIENVNFHGFWTLRLRQLRKWGQHYYTVLFSPLSPFQWQQNIWPWMTLTGYLALNSVLAPVWLAETARLRKIKLRETNKDRHILSAVHIFGRDSSFWRYKVRADIRSGSLETRRWRTVGSVTR